MTPPPEPGALITGGRAPVAVVLARVLARAGLRVYTADSLVPALAARSRAPRGHFTVPSPRFARDACLAEVARLAREHALAAVLPTCEEVYHLAAGRSALPAGVRLLCPDLPVLDRLHHKGACAALAADLGLPVPATTAVRTPADLAALDSERDGILKRAYSRFSCRAIPLLGDPAARRAAASAADLREGEWVHQEFIRGRAVCSYTLCHLGEVLYHVAYATPYTVGLGAGVYYESLPAAPSLAVAARLASATGCTGQLSLDFMERDGVLYLLECNPRATMGAALAAADPAFASALARLVAGEVGPAVVAPPGIRRQAALGMLLYGLRGREAGRSPRRWLRDLLTTPDALASRADPGPMLRQGGILAGYARRARAAGLTLTEFTTHDLEWNGPDGEGAP